MVRRSVKLAQPIVQAYAEGNMTVQVLITRPTPDIFDRDTGRTTKGVPATVYEGPARMYTVSGGASYNLGDEPQDFANSAVSVPLSAPRPRVEDDIEVTAHADATLVGRHYRVTGVDSGGLIPAVHRCTVVGSEPAPRAT